VKTSYLIATAASLFLGLFAQAHLQASQSAPAREAAMFQIPLTSRTVQAVNYEHRRGSTKVDFVGTDMMPQATGHAKVESGRGTMEIGAEFANLERPSKFGSEYLTYVMWAISPEGHAVNLGEVLIGDNHRSKLDATTNLQSFALIVTAEPYYAVHQPSDAVVLENSVREDTKGTTVAIHAKYELMGRGGYLPTGYQFDPVVINANLPLEFFEARNALRIAKSEGAEQYAGDSYRHATELMDKADQNAIAKPIDKKSLIAASRDAVQTAEDARAISVKKMDEARLAQEHQASEDAQASARAQAEAATRSKERADARAGEAMQQKARAESDAAKAQTDAAKAQADMVSNQVASAAAISAAQRETEQAHFAVLRAENDKTILRTQLAQQLNSILQTRDTARGLIISMSDVLFASGQYSLMPGTREKLAKVAGILLAYPSLNIEVGGYTDNVGGDAMNQTLSENRAGSVRDYLVQQGVASASVSAKGFGNTMPIVPNDTSAGRQQNRRVELLVSGDAIGTSANTTTGSLR